MGRITEFIDYINQEHEPLPPEKKSIYNYISFTDRIIMIAKRYRKKMKKENK